MFLLFFRVFFFFFFFSSRRRHTRCLSDWSSDVCSSDLVTNCSSRTARLPYAGSCTGATSWTERPAYRTRVTSSTCARSEERRVGKECRSRWSRRVEKKRKKSEG